MSDVQPGDIVSVNTPSGKREGLVLGSHVDYNVRARPLPAVDC